MKTISFDHNLTSKALKHFKKIAALCKKHGFEFKYTLTPDSGVRRVANPNANRKACSLLGIEPDIIIPQNSIEYDDTIKTTEWELVGVANFTEEPTIYTSLTDDFTITDDLKGQSFVCSHCNAKRSRNKRFFVRKGTEVLSLGSECIKSYLDINPNFFSLYAMYSGFEPGEWVGYYSHRNSSYDTTTIIKLAAASTLKWGYRKSAEENSTASDVHYMLRLLNNEIPITEDSIDQLKETAELLNKVNIDGCVNYWMNTDPSEFNDKFKTAIESGYVSSGWIGIISYSYAGYLRHLEAEAAKKAATETAKPSVHVGTVGERLTIDAEKVAVKYIDNEWGGSHMVTITDKCGNVFVTFTNGECYWLLDKVITGELDINNLEIRGTVKRHSSFRDVAQTNLSRLAVKNLELA